MQELTKKELMAYFEVYRNAFPDWEVKHDVVLTRSLGPIAQNIAFQSLSYGAYRPECLIDVSGPPDLGSRLLHQMLDVKHRQVERRQHANEWPKVLQAIEEQFLPNVRKPLDIAEVVQLAEQGVVRDGTEKIRIMNGLATLNVHLSRNDRAIYWCNRGEQSLEAYGSKLAGWQIAQAEFARNLRIAIEEERGLAFLSNKG